MRTACALHVHYTQAREVERAERAQEYEQALRDDQRAEREREEAEEEARAEVERERHAREAEQARARAEAEEARLTEEARRRRHEALATEPAAGVGVTTIKLKLPDGSTVQRRFRLDGPVSDVYHFLGALP